MVRYAYVCDQCGEELIARARAGEAPKTVACECGGTGRRQYSRNINWGGLELHPGIKRLIDDAPRRRDEYAKVHEEHERQTAVQG